MPPVSPYLLPGIIGFLFIAGTLLLLILLELSYFIIKYDPIEKIRMFFVVLIHRIRVNYISPFYIYTFRRYGEKTKVIIPFSTVYIRVHECFSKYSEYYILKVLHGGLPIYVGYEIYECFKVTPLEWLKIKITRRRIYD